MTSPRKSIFEETKTFPERSYIILGVREGYPDTPFIAANFEIMRTRIAHEQWQRIIDDFGDYPREKATKSSGDSLWSTDWRGFYEPAYFPLTDGVAFLWHTEATFNYRMHKLVITETGDISYSRDPFFEDCQVVAFPLRLEGIDKISENNDAVQGLLWAPKPAEVRLKSS